MLNSSRYRELSRATESTLSGCNSVGRQVRSRPNRCQGFTLIELLVVIAIIALLMSILIPSLSRAREYSRRTVCATHLKGIGVAYYEYDSDNGGLPPVDWGVSNPPAGMFPPTQPNWALWSFFMVHGGYLPGELSTNQGVTLASGPYFTGYNQDGAKGPILYCPDKPTVNHNNDWTSDYSPTYPLFTYPANGSGGFKAPAPVCLERLQHPAALYMIGELMTTYSSSTLIDADFLTGLGFSYTAPLSASGSYDANAHLNTTNMLFADGHAETLDGLVPNQAWSPVPGYYNNAEAYPPWGDWSH